MKTLVIGLILAQSAAHAALNTRDCQLALMTQAQHLRHGGGTPFSRLDGAFAPGATEAILFVRVPGDDSLKLPAHHGFERLEELAVESDGDTYEVLRGSVLELVARRGELALLNPQARVQVIDADDLDLARPRLGQEIARRAPVVREFARPFKALNAKLRAYPLYQKAAYAAKLVGRPVADGIDYVTEPVTMRLAETLNRRRNPQPPVGANVRRELRGYVSEDAGLSDARERELVALFNEFAPSIRLEDEFGLRDATVEVARRAQPSLFRNIPGRVAELNIGAWAPAEMDRAARLAQFEIAWRYVSGLVHLTPDAFDAEGIKATRSRVRREVRRATSVGQYPVADGRQLDWALEALTSPESKWLRHRYPLSEIRLEPVNEGWVVVQDGILKKPAARLRDEVSSAGSHRVSTAVLKQIVEDRESAPILTWDDFSRSPLAHLRRQLVAQEVFAVETPADELVWFVPQETDLRVEFADQKLAPKTAKERGVLEDYVRRAINAKGVPHDEPVEITFRLDNTAPRSFTVRETTGADQLPVIRIEGAIDATEDDYDRFVDQFAKELDLFNKKVEGTEPKFIVGDKQITDVTIPKRAFAEAFLRFGYPPETVTRVVENLRDVQIAEGARARTSFKNRPVEVELGMVKTHWASIKDLRFVLNANGKKSK